MESYTTSRQLRRKGRKRKLLIKFFISILVLTSFISTLLILLHRNDRPEPIISPLGSGSTNAPTTELNALSTNTPLENIIQNALEGTHGTYGIFVKSLDFNADKVFESASLYKLWIMAVIYQKIQSGELQKDQVLSEDVSVLNSKFRIAPDIAEKKDGKITYSVGDGLYNMITISDNYSALLLTEKVGLSHVSLFLKNNGLLKSIVGTNGESPTSTASDIGLFLEKLYKREICK